MGCFKTFFVFTTISVAAVGIIMAFYLPPLPNYIDSLSFKTRLTANVYLIYRCIGFFLADKISTYSNNSFVNVMRQYNKWTYYGRQPDSELIASEDHVFDEVPVRVYIPRDQHPSGRAILYIHGGGWAFYSVDTHDIYARELATELRSLVVSVDYRLAPEHRHSMPLDDCFVALRYLMRNADRWKVNPARVAVAGDSAGGHLSAALTFLWRRAILKRGVELLPPIRLQMLFYPVLQGVNFSTTSYLINRHDPYLAKFSMARYWAWYLLGEEVTGNGADGPLVRAFYVGNHTTRATRQKLARYFEFPLPDNQSNVDDPVSEHVSASEVARASYIRALSSELSPEGDPALEKRVLTSLRGEELSPLLADSFADIPAAYVVTCGQDVLRDEALLYVRRLRQAKIKAHLQHYPNSPHGGYFINTRYLAPSPDIFMNDLRRFLDENPDIF